MADEMFSVRPPCFGPYWQVLIDRGNPDYPTEVLLALIHDEDIAKNLARTLSSSLKEALAADQALLKTRKAITYPAATALANAVVDTMSNMSMDERKQIIDTVAGEWCGGCGGKRPCHCQNDE